MRTLAVVALLLLLTDCAKGTPEPPTIDRIVLDNSWGDSLLVCVEPEIPLINATYLCVELGDLRRSLRSVRQARQ